ncbi:hypothetical protein ACSVH5_00790 [Flavobacterium sp. RSSA_27]|uniref:hypothetical protein n=1 Tax=Flavobacterium sp. RSSA_27 TaxID=3447667 RepID=UPI003F393B20
MQQSSSLKKRIYCTILVTVFIWTLLLWDYFHGGVTSHHLLQNKDLPSFSNWWSGILLPLLTWFLLYRSQVRIAKEATSSALPSSFIAYFVGALLFGIVLSVFFTLSNQDVPFYMIVGLLMLALFLPIYRSECFLGFVIGMTFTFGGVLPVLIGTILVLICSILYLALRPMVLFVYSKIANLLHK